MRLAKRFATALLAVGGVGLAASYGAYRQAARHARERVAGGSALVETPCGVIEYASAGSGAPVLVVHGAGGGFDQGLDVGRGLVERGYRVIAVSRFGYLGTPLPVDASAAAQADAHACLLDALGISSAAVLGVSAGGPSALQFAIRYPQRTAALVLLVPAAYAPREDGGPSLETPPGTRFLVDTALRLDFLFWAAMRVAPSALVRSILGTPPELLDGVDSAEQRRVREMLEHILPVSSRRMGLLNDGLVIPKLERYELERITAPTLVVTARDDLYGTYETGRYTATQIAGARFVAYAEGGHLLVGHQPEADDEIAAFLRR